MMERHRCKSFLTAILLAAMAGIGLFPNSLSTHSMIAVAAQRDIVPEGTVINLRMETALSSERSKVGDPFTATVTQPVTTNDQIVIPAGSRVEGHVTALEQAKRMSKSGMIAVDFDRLILPDGRSYRVYGELTSPDPEERRKIDEESRVSGGSTRNRSIVFIGGGAGLGAVIGVLAGGGKGAAIGTGVGAALGTAAVLLSKGNEAEVKPETDIALRLTERLDLDRSGNYAGGSDSTRYDTQRVDYSSRDMLQRAQRALQQQGYYNGTIDGSYGPRTERAIRDFQRDHRLPQTGRLDERTARELGLISTVAESRTTDGMTNINTGGREVRVTNAFAERLSGDNVRVVLDTETPTGGWRTFGDYSIVNDRVHVWARGVPPSGPATQAITRGRIEVTVPNAPSSTDTVVVHSADRDMTINISPTGGYRTDNTGDRTDGTRTDRSYSSRSAESLRQRTNNFVDQFERLLQVRSTDGRVTFDTRRNYTEDEIELLVALQGLQEMVNTYAGLDASLNDQSAERGAARVLLRQAREVDNLLQRARSQNFDTIARDWSDLRQDFMQLAQTYGLDRGLDRNQDRNSSYRGRRNR